jgi:hypothetical protein
MLSSRLFVGALVALGLVACGASTSPVLTSTSSTPTSPVALQVPAIGDSCLVGSWAILHEQDVTTIGSSTVTLVGLDGTKMTIAASGLQTYDYNASLPLVGDYNGRSLSETMRGTATFQLKATATTLAITAVSADATVTAALDGVPQGSGTFAPTQFASPVYTCTPTRLDLDFANNLGNHVTFTRAA